MAEFYRWSSPSPSSKHLMKSLQQNLPVRLIATPRKDFRVCSHDEPIEDVVKRNVEKFDHFPVTRRKRNGNEHVVGLFELINYDIGKTPRDKVEKHMSSLPEENLIAAETGILDFVKSADTQPCRLLVTATGIEGLVSISDLQQLPVRAALFALITHVEMTMAQVIRLEFNTAAGWVDRLSQRSRDQLQKRIQKTRTANNEVDPLHMTLFSDKIDILLASPYFTKSREHLSTDLNELRNLRDRLVHANEYAADRRSANRVCGIVRKAESWIERLHASCDRLGNGAPTR
jgi:hypothetical protein